MQATIIVPIVSLIALLLKELFGVTLGESEQAIIVDGLIAVSLGAVALYGIFQSYKTKKSSKLNDKSDLK